MYYVSFCPAKICIVNYRILQNTWIWSVSVINMPSGKAMNISEYVLTPCSTQYVPLTEFDHLSVRSIELLTSLYAEDVRVQVHYMMLKDYFNTLGLRCTSRTRNCTDQHLYLRLTYTFSASCMDIFLVFTIFAENIPDTKMTSQTSDISPCPRSRHGTIQS